MTADTSLVFHSLIRFIRFTDEHLYFRKLVVLHSSFGRGRINLYLIRACVQFCEFFEISKRSIYFDLLKKNGISLKIKTTNQ